MAGGVWRRWRMLVAQAGTHSGRMTARLKRAGLPGQLERAVAPCGLAASAEGPQECVEVNSSCSAALLPSNRPQKPPPASVAMYAAVLRRAQRSSCIALFCALEVVL